MKLLLGSALLLLLGPPTRLDSFDMRARYGEPDVQRFAIRPDVTMTVEYGTDHKACILDIEPRQSFIRGTIPQMKVIPKEQMLQLLDEVAPPEMRGAEKVPLFSSDSVTGSQCLGHSTFGQYTNAGIGLSYIVCNPPMGGITDGMEEARVQFKRPACESLTKWNGP
jgi:hypothetical protein